MFQSRLGEGVRALSAVALLASLQAASGGCEREPVKIGFVGGLSGRVADLGISGRNGAMLAVEQKNAAGGVGRRPLRLIVRDDGQDVAKALEADRELIRRGVAAIIGHMTSAMSEAGLPLANESGTVMVSPTTTTTYLTGIDDSFIRVSATTREYAAAMARHLREREGAARAAVIYDLRNRSYSESWLQEFKREFTTRGGVIAAVTSYESGPGVHFSEVVDRALAPGADVLVIVASAMDAAMFCQQVRKTGRQVLVAAAEWAGTEKLLEFGGSAVEGIIVGQFFDRESRDPDYAAWRDLYRKRFGEEPGFASVNAYDATSLVIEGLERQKRGQSLKEAILGIGTFQGVQGKVSIDRYGDADRRTYITSVRDGRFQVLE